MELTQVKILLKKYYQSETTANEEKQLKDYFNTHEVPDELKVDRYLFQSLSDFSNEQGVSDDVSAEIISYINDYEQDRKSAKLTFRKKLTIYLSAAASIAILLTASLFIYQNRQYDEDRMGTITDPEKAYEQTKETLMYVSSLMNKSKQYLEPLEKFSEAEEEMKPIRKINESMKELDKIHKFKILVNEI